jgi:hypothetical protein
MRVTLLVRSREQRIATATTNIRQYYTTDPQTDGILVLVQDEGDTTREIYRGENSNGYNKHQAILHHRSTDGILVLVKDEGDTTREIYRGENSNGYNKHKTILHHRSTNRWSISISTG